MLVTSEDLPIFPHSGWTQIHGGGAFSLCDFTHDITGLTVEDIASALAQINRFKGATHFPISVAQHSSITAHIVAALGGSLDAQMAAIAHDAHEIVIGDTPSPMKRSGAINTEHLKRLESKIDAALWPIIGASGEMGDYPIVKEADAYACAIEASLFLRGTRYRWNMLPEPPAWLVDHLKGAAFLRPMYWDKASQLWLAHRSAILGAMSRAP